MGAISTNPPVEALKREAPQDDKPRTTIILSDEKNEEKSSPFRPLSDRVSVWE